MCTQANSHISFEEFYSFRTEPQCDSWVDDSGALLFHLLNGIIPTSLSCKNLNNKLMCMMFDIPVTLMLVNFISIK